MHRRRRRFSLRTELLLNIALLAATALALGVSGVLLLYDAFDAARAPMYISILVVADVCILLAYVAWQVERVMIRPLHRSMETAEAIASGDLARRLEPGDTRELDNLATSVNRMTDRLLEERAHLVRAEKLASVGRLAAGIAHEVGNPLGAMNGYLHVLRTAAPGSEIAREALDGLERETGRIDRIVRGLLEYARPGRLTGRADVDAVARAAADLLAAQGALRDVTLDVSPAGEPVWVAAEAHDLEQVLVNLLLNAVDAAGAGGRIALVVRRATRGALLAGRRRESDPAETGIAPSPPSPRVERWLSATDVRDVAVVTVSDSGPGVPDDDLERVFDPFYTTKEPGKGTGLGLAIVARAVENAGGIVWATRAREGGAAFRMLLPLAAQAYASSVAAPVPTRESPEGVAATARVSGGRSRP